MYHSEWHQNQLGNGLLTNYSVKLTQLYELCQNQNINLEKVEKLVFELTMINVLECLIES